MDDDDITATTATAIDLAELLSTCIDACRRGCEVIRNVRHKCADQKIADQTDDDAGGRLAAGVDSVKVVVENVLYKIPDDPRSALTEADGASQRVIVECLTSAWEPHIRAGRIKLVGEEEDEHSTDLEGCDEEDEDDHNSSSKNNNNSYHHRENNIVAHFDNYNCPRPDVEPIRRDMFRHEQPAWMTVSSCSGRHPTEREEEEDPVETINNNDKLQTSSGVRLQPQHDEIIVFIDPMDGTREFVEGRIQNVQCLIGITVNGVPVAGAMGMPMVHDRQIEIAYGLIAPPPPSSSLEKTKEEGESGNTATIMPVLSGVKFFDSINPLDIASATNTKNHVFGGEDHDNNDDDDDDTLMIFSGDSMKPALNLAMDCLENQILRVAEGNEEVQDDVALPNNERRVNNTMHPPIRKIVAGGCGHKILSLQRHVQSVSSRHAQDEEDYKTVGAISIGPPGSSSWDTAAPTAVLLAVDPNARVTDLLGRPLLYDGENLSNNLGIVVSSGYAASKIHEALCMKLCHDDALLEVLGITDVDPQSTAFLELDNL